MIFKINLILIVFVKKILKGYKFYMSVSLLNSPLRPFYSAYIRGTNNFLVLFKAVNSPVSFLFECHRLFIRWNVFILIIIDFELLVLLRQSELWKIWRFRLNLIIIFWHWLKQRFYWFSLPFHFFQKLFYSMLYIFSW